MLRKRKNKLYKEPPLDEEVENENRKFDLTEPLRSNRFDQVIDKYLLRMTGQEMNLKFIQKSGFDKPILLVQPDGLNLKMPPKSFLVRDVKNCVGSDRLIDVMDVKTQKNIQMTMKDFCKYYESKHKDKLLNVISLEFSHTKLDELVESPMIVKLLDWVDLVWPKALKESQTESTNTIQAMKYPKVQKYCLMSVKGSYTDFHIDFGGTSVWYHIIKGRKIFWMVPPTELNLQVFEHWTLSGNPQHLFLGDTVEDCFRVELEQGNTFFIPSGWIHAVYTLEDSLVFGGNFLHSFSIENQLRVSKIEDATKVPAKFRYPFYTELSWYVIQHYVHCLTGRDHLHKLELANSSNEQVVTPSKQISNVKAKEAIENHIDSDDDVDENEDNDNDNNANKHDKKQSKSKLTPKKKVIEETNDSTEDEEEKEEEEEEEEDDSDELDDDGPSTSRRKSSKRNCKKSQSANKLKGIGKNAKATAKNNKSRTNNNASSSKKALAARSSKKAQLSSRSKSKAKTKNNINVKKSGAKRGKASNKSRGKRKANESSSSSDADDTETDIDENANQATADKTDDDSDGDEDSTDIDSSAEETINNKTANTCRMTKNSLSRLQYEILEDKSSTSGTLSSSTSQQPPKKSIKLSKEDKNIRKKRVTKQELSSNNSDDNNNNNNDDDESSDEDDDDDNEKNRDNNRKQIKTMHDLKQEPNFIANDIDPASIIGSASVNNNNQKQQAEKPKLDLSQMMLDYSSDSMKLNGWSCASGGHSIWSEAAKSSENVVDQAANSTKKLEKDKTKILLTRFELDGLKALMKHLGKLSGTKKNLPSLIRNSRVLLDDCRRMLIEHENDDPELAATGKPITLETIKQLTEAAENELAAANSNKLDMNQMISQFFKSTNEDQVDVKPHNNSTNHNHHHHHLAKTQSSLMLSSSTTNSTTTTTTSSKLAALAAATMKTSTPVSHETKQHLNVKSSGARNNSKAIVSAAAAAASAIASQHNKRPSSSPSKTTSSPIKMIDSIPQPARSSSAKSKQKQSGSANSATDSHATNTTKNTKSNNNNYNIHKSSEETKCLSPNKKGATQLINTQNNINQHQEKRAESPPTRPISNNQYRPKNDIDNCLPNSFADLIAATSTNKPKVYDVTGLDIKKLNCVATNPTITSSEQHQNTNDKQLANSNLVQKPVKPSTSDLSIGRSNSSGGSNNNRRSSSSASSTSGASSTSPADISSPNKQQQANKMPSINASNTVINSNATNIPAQQQNQQQQVQVAPSTADSVVAAKPSPAFEASKQSQIVIKQQQQQQQQQQPQQQPKFPDSPRTSIPIIIEPQPRPSKPKPVSNNKYLNRSISSTSTPTSTSTTAPSITTTAMTPISSLPTAKLLVTTPIASGSIAKFPSMTATTLTTTATSDVSTASASIVTTAASGENSTNQFQERPTVIVVATKKKVDNNNPSEKQLAKLSQQQTNDKQSTIGQIATDYSMQTVRTESQPLAGASNNGANASTQNLQKRIILPIASLATGQQHQLLNPNPLNLVDNVQQYQHLNQQQLQQLQAHQRHQLQLHHQLQQQQHQQIQNQLQFHQQQQQQQQQQHQQLQMQLQHQYQLQQQQQLQKHNQSMQSPRNRDSDSTNMHLTHNQQPSSSSSSPGVANINNNSRSSSAKSKIKNSNNDSSLFQSNGLGGAEPSRSTTQSPQQQTAPLQKQSKSSSSKRTSKSEKQKSKSQAELQQQATNARLSAAIPAIRSGLPCSGLPGQQAAIALAHQAYLPIGQLSTTTTTPVSAAAAVAAQNARLAANLNQASLHYFRAPGLIPGTLPVTSGATLLATAPQSTLPTQATTTTRALLMHPNSLFLQANRLPHPETSASVTPKQQSSAISPATTSSSTTKPIRSPIDNTALISLANTALSTAPSTTMINMAASNPAASLGLPFNAPMSLGGPNSTAFTTSPSHNNHLTHPLPHLQHSLPPTHLHSLAQFNQLNQQHAHNQQQQQQQLQQHHHHLLLGQQHPSTAATSVVSAGGQMPLIALRPTTGIAGSAPGIANAAAGFNLAASQALFNPYLSRLPIPTVSSAAAPPIPATSAAAAANGVPNPGQLVYLLPPYGGYFMNQNRARST